MQHGLFFLVFSLISTMALAQNTSYAGIYKCSDEDIIRLNANGTGKFIISYIYDGALPFYWKFNAEEKTINLELILNEEQKYTVGIQYLTLNYNLKNGRQVLSHYTSGPTYLYVKQ